MTETEILTDRLKLRLIELSDLDAIHRLHSLPETDEVSLSGIDNEVSVLALFVSGVLGIVSRLWVILRG